MNSRKRVGHLGEDLVTQSESQPMPVVTSRTHVFPPPPPKNRKEKKKTMKERNQMKTNTSCSPEEYGDVF